MYKLIKKLNQISLVFNIINILFLLIIGKTTLLIWPLVGMVGALYAIKSLELLEKELDGDKNDNS